MSVVLPCYNAADHVNRALDSIRSQDYDDIEVVAVDDASQDDTRERLAQAKDLDLRIVALARNGGVSAARNAGIEQATGEFVAFLDADDEWLPEKLGTQVAQLRADPDCALATCDSLLVRADGREVRHHSTARLAEGPDAWRQLLRGNFIPTPTVMTRRRLLEQVGPFDVDMRYGEDYDMWLRLARCGSVALHTEVLARIHARPEGLTFGTLHGESEFVVPMVERHLEAQADRLSAEQVREIRGHLHFDVALRARVNALHGIARRHFAQSLRNRHRVAKSAIFLALSTLQGGWRR